VSTLEKMFLIAQCVCVIISILEQSVLIAVIIFCIRTICCDYTLSLYLYFWNVCFNGTVSVYLYVV